MCAICAPTNATLTAECFDTAFNATKIFIPAQITTTLLPKKWVQMFTYVNSVEIDSVMQVRLKDI